MWHSVEHSETRAWTFWNRGRWKEAEALEVYAETHAKALDAEYVDSLVTGMNDSVFTSGRYCISEKCPAERTHLREQLDASRTSRQRFADRLFLRAIKQ